MDNFNLFEMCGIEVPQVEAKKEEKKAEKTEKKTNTKTKVAVKHNKGTIKTGFGTFHYEEGTIAEIAASFEAEYPGYLTLAEFGTASSICVGKKRTSKGLESPDTKLPKGTLVAFGCYQFTTDADGTVGEALNAFAGQFPDFEGCRGVMQGETLCPVIIAEANEPAITFPAHVGFGTDVISVTEVPDTTDYRKELMKRYEKEYQVKISDLHYNSTVNKWLPVYKMASSTAASTPVKKEDKKYKLPFTIKTPNESFEVTVEDFIDKTEVTAEEARKILEARYFEYSKERTVMDYDESRNTFIAILKSSTKGAVRHLRNGDFDYRNGELAGFSTMLP